MEQEQEKQNNLLDSTDCLEAVGVFRTWKNILFLIVLLCLLLLQGAFWLANMGCVRVDEQPAAVEPKSQAAMQEQAPPVVPEIEQAAQQAAAANQPAEAVPAPEKTKRKISLRLGIKAKQLTGLVRALNFILVPAAVLYCLTILFSLKLSLLGRLGGINHITRAFFISLVLVVVLMPWQKLFTPVIFGVIYTPQELLKACRAGEHCKTPSAIFHYFRFTALWVAALLLLIGSQVRTHRWVQAVVRRLEVI